MRLSFGNTIAVTAVTNPDRRIVGTVKRTGNRGRYSSADEGRGTRDEHA
jgi:hypothetical protein